MLVIRNFGDFWSREDVQWWSRGKGLFGYSKRVDSADFSEQIGIYLLQDTDRNTVYVGQSGSGSQRLFTRLRDHTRGRLRERWSHFSWFGFRKVNKNGSLSEQQKSESLISASHSSALNEIEAVLLQILEPPLNRQGPRWKETEEFFQYDPRELSEFVEEDFSWETQAVLRKAEVILDEIKSLTAKE